MRIAIIGAGIAGSSAARIARELGHDVTLIDGNPDQAASRCALATIRPQWFPAELKGTLNRSWEWYEKWGAAVTQYAQVSNWRNLDFKIQKDWWLVDADKCLETPDIPEHATWFGIGEVHFENRDPIEADAILVATGAYGGTLGLEHEPLWGATLFSHNARLDAGPLRIHHLRPYHTLTVSDSRGQIRLGSSIAKTEADAIRGANQMLDDAVQAGIVNDGAEWSVRTGIRARVKGNNSTLPEPGAKLAYIGNLARSGYAISPAAVEDWIRSL